MSTEASPRSESVHREPGRHEPGSHDSVRTDQHLSNLLPRRGHVLEERTGSALGWLSIALGVTALLAPRAVSRAAGMSEQNLLLRAVGARELVSGIGLLTQRSRTPWLWSRVLGDAMDVALIGSSALGPRVDGRRSRAWGALAVVGAISAVDLAASLRHSRRLRHEGPPISGAPKAFFEQSIAVNKSPRECYAFWRDFRNLPRFMPMLKSVTPRDEHTSHWVMQAPGGMKLEWDAEVTADREGERIAWHSRPGAAVKHSSTVRFEPAPGGRGCIVRALVQYQPPLGRAGLAFARLMGRDPQGQARENLRHFKQLLETGEIPTTSGQPSGRRSWMGRMVREGRQSRQGHILQGRRH